MAERNRPAEFEEREFETVLNGELNEKRNLIYTPGLVKERHLGFDAALLCRRREFWKLFPAHTRALPPPLCLFPFRRSPKGIELNPDYWPALNQTLPHFPAMKFNLIIQYKRPLHVRYFSSGEWQDWNEPYFRYDITPHQQLALEGLEQCAGDDALVVYASPAFATLNELWDRSKCLIARTNFAKVGILAGHHKYSYRTGGAHGRAHSDTTGISGPDFDAELQRLAAKSRSPEQNAAFLMKSAAQVDEVMSRGALSAAYRQVAAPDGVDGMPPIAYALKRISAFCILTNSNWMIGI